MPVSGSGFAGSRYLPVRSATAGLTGLHIALIAIPALLFLLYIVWCVWQSLEEERKAALGRQTRLREILRRAGIKDVPGGKDRSDQETT
jgi:choline-glycine betaine transporter